MRSGQVPKRAGWPIRSGKSYGTRDRLAAASPECSNPALSQDRAGAPVSNDLPRQIAPPVKPILLNGSNEAWVTEAALMMISGRAGNRQRRSYWLQ
jgi:hypothetical protein